MSRTAASSKQQNNKNSKTTTKIQANTARGVARLSFLFFFFIYFIKFNLFIQFLQIQFKFNSNSIQIRTSFLNDARELVAREVRQTCAARSGRARSGPVSRSIS